MNTLPMINNTLLGMIAAAIVVILAGCTDFDWNFLGGKRVAQTLTQDERNKIELKKIQDLCDDLGCSAENKRVHGLKAADVFHSTYDRVIQDGVTRPSNASRYALDKARMFLLGEHENTHHISLTPLFFKR